MNYVRMTLGVACVLAAWPVAAQLPAVSSIGKVVIRPEQAQMLEAAKKVQKQDLEGAIAIYNQVLAVNPQFIEAYLQRGVIRREKGDARGATQDANAVVLLTSQSLQKKNDARLLRQRAGGYRILKEFDKAKADIEQAASLDPGRSNWRAEMQAIALEEKLGK